MSGMTVAAAEQAAAVFSAALSELLGVPESEIKEL